MSDKLSYCSLILAAFLVAAGSITAKEPVTVHLGFFEGGSHSLHSAFREEFQRQLTALSPTDTQFVFIPTGYRNADWVRDTSLVMAQQLAANPDIDIMIAIGPWVVEDLLAAGFDRPTLGIRQLDPAAIGLLDEQGRPIAENLTVHNMTGKIEDDVFMLTRLMPVKRLGVLLFPSNDAERDAVLGRIRAVTAPAGIEVVTAEGFDNSGTYAFFKALSELPTPVDALYLGPLWGMEIQKINEFLKKLNERRLPTFTWEGRFLVSRGALATNYAYGLAGEARFQALKVLRIAQGENPADLPVEYRAGSSLAINEGTARNARLDLPPEALISAELFPAPPSESAERYSLADAARRVRSSNPGYLASQEAINRAAAAAGEAAAAYRPQVGLEAEFGYLDDNSLNNTVEPLANQQFRGQLVLDQTVFSLEAIRSIKAAGRRRDMKELDQEQARLDIELAVSAAYLEHTRAQDELTVEQRYQEVIERSLEITASRAFLEGHSDADVLRWRDERQQIISRILAARNRKHVTGVMLNVLLNLPAEMPIVLADTPAVSSRLYRDYEVLSAAAVKPASRTRLENALVNAALADAPVLRFSDARLGLQQTLLSQNTARFWPSVALRASIGMVDQIDDDLGDIDEKNNTWSVYAQVRLPLYLGGKRFRENSRLKAEMNELEYRRDAETLALVGRIRHNAGRLITTLNSIPRNDRSRQLAIENMRFVTAEYEAGQRDIVSILDAIFHARETELRNIAARYDYLEMMARLTHDIGWSPSSAYGNFYDEFHNRLRDLLRPDDQE